VPAPASARARLACGLAAVAVAAGLAAAPVLGGQVLRPALAWLAVAGLAAAATGVWRFPALIPVALGLLVAEYAVSTYERGGPVDVRAPLFGAGVLLLAELAGWSRESRALVRDERPVLAARACLLAALVAGALGLGAAALLAAGAPLGGGLARLAVGVLAATAVVVLVGALARRTATRPRWDQGAG
jgi:hypothetical protein